jgi:hypothetical protein
MRYLFSSPGKPPLQMEKQRLKEVRVPMSSIHWFSTRRVSTYILPSPRLSEQRLHPEGQGELDRSQQQWWKSMLMVSPTKHSVTQSMIVSEGSRKEVSNWLFGDANSVSASDKKTSIRQVSLLASCFSFFIKQYHNSSKFSLSSRFLRSGSSVFVCWLCKCSTFLFSSLKHKSVVTMMFPSKTP